MSLTPEKCCLLSPSPFSPCSGPIGCQRGHSSWEEPMSDWPWLRVKPIRLHKTVTLKEMLGIAGRCLQAPAGLTESRTPWREKKSNYAITPSSPIRIPHRAVFLASLWTDKGQPPPQLMLNWRIITLGACGGWQEKREKRDWERLVLGEGKEGKQDEKKNIYNRRGEIEQ